MTAHGAIMLAGGCLFGLAVARNGPLPRWTGICLMTGAILVVAASGLPKVERTIAEAFPTAAFIGMGTALLGRRHKQLVHQPHRQPEQPERPRMPQLSDPRTANHDPARNASA